MSTAEAGRAGRGASAHCSLHPTLGCSSAPAAPAAPARWGQRPRVRDTGVAEFGAGGEWDPPAHVQFLLNVPGGGPAARLRKAPWTTPWTVAGWAHSRRAGRGLLLQEKDAAHPSLRASRLPVLATSDGVSVERAVLASQRPSFSFSPGTRPGLGFFSLSIGSRDPEQPGHCPFQPGTIRLLGPPRPVEPSRPDRRCAS